ncbi:MAG: hypothetical protein IJ221_03385 [Oscillibacter sp.]|nr:hypothetical protein [Oscillibacter sp.]
MIVITWVYELIEHIPDILQYIAPGFITICLYRFISCTDREFDAAYHWTLLESVVISYCCHVALFWVPARYMVPSVFLLSILAGFAAGKWVHSKSCDRLLKALGIHRTTHANIWLDALPSGTFLRIWPDDSGMSYLGQMKYMEEHEREPLIVLQKYQILDEHSKVVLDYTEDPRRMVMLNLKGFRQVRLEHY